METSPGGVVTPPMRSGDLIFRDGGEKKRLDYQTGTRKRPFGKKE